MVLSFDEAPEFRRDTKTLTKKWRSIPRDLEKAKAVIMPLYVPVDGVDIRELRNQFFATNRATLLEVGDDYEVVKMRLDCASLGNDKKTRIVFVAKVQSGVVTFIELYAKNDKDREDTARIKKYLPK